MKWARDYGQEMLKYLAEERWVTPRVMASALNIANTSTVTQALTWLTAQKLYRIAAKGSYTATQNGVTFVRYMISDYKEPTLDFEVNSKDAISGEEDF
jgi:Mn-dependent DtxR family transcriptional regulator